MITIFWHIKNIENVFKVEFKKLEKNIANLISANLKIIMDGIKKTQDKMKKGRKRSNRLKTKPWIYRKPSGREGEEARWKACELGQPMEWTLNLESKESYNKLVYLEGRSRRNNLKIDGIAEGSNESKCTCKMCLKKNFAWIMYKLNVHTD